MVWAGGLLRMRYSGTGYRPPSKWLSAVLKLLLWFVVVLLSCNLHFRGLTRLSRETTLAPAMATGDQFSSLMPRFESSLSRSKLSSKLNDLHCLPRASSHFITFTGESHLVVLLSLKTINSSSCWPRLRSKSFGVKNYFERLVDSPSAPVSICR